jgi:hypothetical protein
LLKKKKKFRQETSKYWLVHSRLYLVNYFLNETPKLLTPVKKNFNKIIMLKQWKYK